MAGLNSVIELHGVSKRYGDMLALDNVSIDIARGEFVVIVGASGCGKSTTLNMIAGFEKPSTGQVKVEGNIVSDVHTKTGMVFQQYALFPWLTVVDNIAYGLKMKGIGKRERRKLAQKYVDMVGLRGFEKSYPKQLSGGMKQRVTIARVLANDPSVMLFDEPFAALDAMTRQVLQEELIRIYETSGKTVVFITHSIDEALMLSSRIIILSARPGRIAQDIPNDLPHPRNADVQLSQQYLEMKQKIWITVQGEVSKALGAKA
ncbi:ABC transporter ATP-binding protein [Burkholderia anthina]|uniref:ABC transporter ATP-binding protein n=1 Tax=Burkholderia anthina TaxID=179879 RepID=UPI001AA072BC|nr:ABC transporter ATP-binding protein [Burkholderia anthina]QTD94930.1 ABC transporter ATP-binding protein [Burkholderia anthina]